MPKEMHAHVAVTFHKCDVRRVKNSFSKFLLHWELQNPILIHSLKQISIKQNCASPIIPGWKISDIP